MTSITLNGPVIGSTTNNVVLRDALLHSPVDRTTASFASHKVEVGVREGEFTSWVGTWDQATQDLEGASPTSILDGGRKNMRLKASQAVVVRASVDGVPASLAGSSVTIRLGRVGGSSGQPKPLVSAGAVVGDPNSRVAISTLERQINSVLSEWEVVVQLPDPVTLGVVGSFQAILQYDSTTQISLAQLEGNWIEVDGKFVSVTSSGLPVATTSGILMESGAVSSTAPSSSTTYYAYVNVDAGLRLSATAPALNNGVYYLGTASVQTGWRYCGWAYLDGSTLFSESDMGQRDSV